MVCYIRALLDGIVGFLEAQPEHSEQVLRQLYTYIISVGWPVKASLIGLIVFHVLNGHQLLHRAVTLGSVVDALGTTTYVIVTNFDCQLFP